MQIKAEYIAGIIEYDYGPDLKRAEYHFEKFFQHCELFEKRKLKHHIPEVEDMVEHADNYRKNIIHGKARPSKEYTKEEKAKEAAEFKALWDEFELLKMDVRPESSWYIIS